MYRRDPPLLPEHWQAEDPIYYGQAHVANTLGMLPAEYGARFLGIPNVDPQHIGLDTSWVLPTQTSSSFLSESSIWEVHSSSEPTTLFAQDPMFGGLDDLSMLSSSEMISTVGNPHSVQLSIQEYKYRPKRKPKTTVRGRPRKISAEEMENIKPVLREHYDENNQPLDDLIKDLRLVHNFQAG